MAKNTFFVLIGFCIVFAAGFWYSGYRASTPILKKNEVPTKNDVGNVYTSATYGFSIDVPQGFTIDDAYVHQLSPDKTINGVKFTIPESLATGTNLGSDSYLSVESISGVTTCTASMFLDGDHPATNETIDGKTYSVTTSSNAGAGNRYEETVYAIPGSNPCMAIRYAVHYSIIENYPAGTKEFDKEALLGEFNTMRNSLSLTQ